MPSCPRSGTFTGLLTLRSLARSAPLGVAHSCAPTRAASEPQLPQKPRACTLNHRVRVGQLFCSYAAFENLPASGYLLDTWKLRCAVKAWQAMDLSRWWSPLVPAGDQLQPCSKAKAVGGSVLYPYL